MRKGIPQLLCVLVAIGGALALDACGAAGQANPGSGASASREATGTSSPAPGTLDLATLTNIARNGIASEGGQDVTSADAVLTTRDKANAAASGAVIPSDEAVYLIQLKGQFTAYGASLAQNATGYPTGAYLTLIAEASNGQVVDWGVGSQGADLASLGTVIALPL
jgi:hypothetical protein